MSRNTKWTAAMIGCAAVLISSVFMSGFGILEAAGFAYPHAGKYTVGDAEISGEVKNLDVNWVSGKVSILYYDGNTVELHEQANKKTSADQQMRWWLDGNTLRVQYAKAGFLMNGNLQKELTVRLPESIRLENVNVSATSGALDISALQAEDLVLDTTSGDILVSADARQVSASATSGKIELRIMENAEKISAGTTSGNIVLETGSAEKIKASSTSGEICAKIGRVREVRADTTSGDIYAEIRESEKMKTESTSGSVTVKLEKMESLEIDTTSGNISVTLPEKPGFTARLETVSGTIQNSLPLSGQGKAYTCGDGSGTVKIDTTSGDIRIASLEG